MSDGSEDPDTTPFLEIADQKGNPLKIPHKERKVESSKAVIRSLVRLVVIHLTITTQFIKLLLFKLNVELCM